MKIDSKFRSTIPCAIIVLNISMAANVSAAQNSGELDGIYNVTRGWAESQEIGASPNPGEPIEQLGRYKVTLKRQDWNLLSPAEKTRIKKVLVISGVFRGKLVGFNGQNPLFDHVMGNEDRTGAVFTENDFLTSPPNFAPCGTDNLVTISGIEQLNPIKGIGIYSNLKKSTILVNVTVDQCTLQNDLQFIPQVSYLCFEGNTICP